MVPRGARANGILFSLPTPTICLDMGMEKSAKYSPKKLHSYFNMTLGVLLIHRWFFCESCLHCECVCVTCTMSLYTLCFVLSLSRSSRISRAKWHKIVKQTLSIDVLITKSNFLWCLYVFLLSTAKHQAVHKQTIRGSFEASRHTLLIKRLNSKQDGNRKSADLHFFGWILCYSNSSCSFLIWTALIFSFPFARLPINISEWMFFLSLQHEAQCNFHGFLASQNWLNGNPRWIDI